METTQCVYDKYTLYSVNRDTSDKKVYWIVVGRFWYCRPHLLSINVLDTTRWSFLRVGSKQTRVKQSGEHKYLCLKRWEEGGARYPVRRFSQTKYPSLMVTPPPPPPPPHFTGHWETATWPCSSSTNIYKNTRVLLNSAQSRHRYTFVIPSTHFMYVIWSSTTSHLTNWQPKVNSPPLQKFSLNLHLDLRWGWGVARLCLLFCILATTYTTIPIFYFVLILHYYHKKKPLPQVPRQINARKKDCHEFRFSIFRIVISAVSQMSQVSVL